ncbi:MAG: hypothetical protein LBL79_01025 [Prevotella sp.]|jgi:hypothetical protein|nr:hypothetical protein [Prevotella sp.]
MNDIDKLLEKYFEGETSSQEEKILRDYFLQAKIEDRHKAYKPIFNFFSEEMNEISPKKKTNKSHFRWIGIAAGILIIAGIWSLFYIPNVKETKSLVYVDGKEITDAGLISAEVLNSIDNITNINEEVINTQIGVLDSFTE